MVELPGVTNTDIFSVCAEVKTLKNEICIELSALSTNDNSFG